MGRGKGEREGEKIVGGVERGEGGEKENRGMKRKGFVFIFESRARGRKKKLNFSWRCRVMMQVVCYMTDVSFRRI